MRKNVLEERNHRSRQASLEALLISLPRSLGKNQRNTKVVQEIEAIPKERIDAHIQKIEIANFQN